MTKKREPKAPKPEKQPISTFIIDGKPYRHATRTFTLGYLASLVVGGKGATAKLRKMLAEAGIDDPEHTTWTFTTPGGKVAGGIKRGDPVPEAPKGETRKARSGKAKAADRVAAYQASKAAAAAAKAVGVDKAVDGSKVLAPSQPGKVAAARKSRKAPPAVAATA